MKKFIFKFMSAATMLVALGLNSCDNNQGNDTKPESNILSGTISNSRTLDASITYILDGTLVVEDGGVLTIPAGTTIKAKEGFSSYILVARGGKIFANGTAEAPITLTADSNSPRAGFWGGLIINGKAPISGPADVNEGTTEVATEYSYGGNDASDNSGSIRYVKLLYTGANNGDDVEHNGLTLNGVGNGTEIDHIYVAYGNDDAIEFFGGSVNVSNFLSVNADDDLFDFTQGYTGTLSNCYGVWEAEHRSTEKDPRGVEADGNLDGIGPDHLHQSDFKINGMTIDMRAGKADEVYMHDAIKVRRGAKCEITNAVVKGSGLVMDIIDLTDGKGNANEDSKIDVTNSLTTPIAGKEIKLPENTEYPNVTTGKTNTGANSSVFGWTGYKI